MIHLSILKISQNFRTPMAGTSVTKATEFVDEVRSTISKVMTASDKEGKTSTLKQNSGRKQKLSVTVGL